MPTTRKIRCVVIDDEPLAREILKQHYSRRGSSGTDGGMLVYAVEAISFLKNKLLILCSSTYRCHNCWEPILFVH
jgi:hypothetical protein